MRHNADQAEQNRQALATDHLVTDLGGRAASGGLIAIGAQAVRALLHLTTLAILARLLPPEDFGLVAMATTVTAFVGMFTELGLGAATVQRERIDQDTVSALFLVNICMGLVIMVAAVALAPVAAWFFDDHRVGPLVIALALPIPLVAASRQHAALLQRGMRWVALQWTAIGAQLSGAVIAVGLAWWSDLGHWALVSQSWVTAVMTLVLLWGVCPWRPSRIGNWRGARSAVAFGLHLTGFQFLNYFQRQFDDVLIGWRWGAADLGHYTRAYELLRLPLQLVRDPVASAVLPALSRLQDNPQRWRNAFLEAFGATMLFMSGVTAVLIATAEPLVVLVFGPAWEPAAEVLSLLAISLFGMTVLSGDAWIYLSLGKTRRMFLWNLCVATPTIIASFIIGLPYGPAGVALSYSVAVSLLAIPGLAVATRVAPVSLAEVLKTAGPVVAVGAIAAVSGCAAPAILPWQDPPALQAFLVSGTVAGAVYLCGAAAFATLTEAGMRALRSGLRHAPVKRLRLH